MDNIFDELTSSLPDISYHPGLKFDNVSIDDSLANSLNDIVKETNINSLNHHLIPLLSDSEVLEFYLNKNISKLVQGTAEKHFVAEDKDGYTFEFCNFKDVTLDVYGSTYFLKDCFIDGLTLKNAKEAFILIANSENIASYLLLVVGFDSPH